MDLPHDVTTVPLHLTVDPAWDTLVAIAFGRVEDGLPPAQTPAIDDDERIEFVLDAPGKGPVIGFRVAEPHDVDIEAVESDALWTGPRFDVPALGLMRASAGEIVLAVQARYRTDEGTADALHFHAAIGFGGDDEDEDPAAAEDHFKLALEAGNMKALFGLGYTLVEAGRAREAYDFLRRYTELTPHNAWAWCWLGRACADLGAIRDACSAYERALDLEEEGSFETDAGELLARLEGSCS